MAFYQYKIRGTLEQRPKVIYEISQRFIQDYDFKILEKVFSPRYLKQFSLSLTSQSKEEDVKSFLLYRGTDDIFVVLLVSFEQSLALPTSSCFIEIQLTIVPSVVSKVYWANVSYRLSNVDQIHLDVLSLIHNIKYLIFVWPIRLRLKFVVSGSLRYCSHFTFEVTVFQNATNLSWITLLFFTNHAQGFRPSVGLQVLYQISAHMEHICLSEFRMEKRK